MRILSLLSFATQSLKQESPRFIIGCNCWSILFRRQMSSETPCPCLAHKVDDSCRKLFVGYSKQTARNLHLSSRQLKQPASAMKFKEQLSTDSDKLDHDEARGRLEVLDSQEQNHLKKTVLSTRPPARFVYDRPVLQTCAEKQALTPPRLVGESKKRKGKRKTQETEKKKTYETLMKEKEALKKAKALDKRKSVEKRASLNVKALLEALKAEQDRKFHSMYEQNFYAKLRAFCHACVLAEDPGKAYDTLRYYNERSGVGLTRGKILNVKDPDSFNIVLEAFARAGNPRKVLRTLEWMEREGVVNMRTVSAVCLLDPSLKLEKDHSSEPQHTTASSASNHFTTAAQVIQYALSMAETAGLDIRKVFQDGYRSEMDRGRILDTLGNVVENFQLAPPEPLVKKYDKKLLSGLNQPPLHYFQSPYAGLFTKGLHTN